MRPIAVIMAAVIEVPLPPVFDFAQTSVDLNPLHKSLRVLKE